MPIRCLALLAAALFVACSDGSTHELSDASVDADTTVDASTSDASDGGIDARVDAGDAGPRDSGMDARSDANANDASIPVDSTMPDASADATTDSGPACECASGACCDGCNYLAQHTDCGTRDFYVCTGPTNMQRRRMYSRCDSMGSCLEDTWGSEGYRACPGGCLVLPAGDAYCFLANGDPGPLP
jgi:hypothetical protein